MGNDEKVDATRRRLLKIAVYAPPAILGAVALRCGAGDLRIMCDPDTCSPDFTAPPSPCGPANCAPINCHPVVTPCQPLICNPIACNPIG